MLSAPAPASQRWQHTYLRMLPACCSYSSMMTSANSATSICECDASSLTYTSLVHPFHRRMGAVHGCIAQRAHRRAHCDPRPRFIAGTHVLQLALLRTAHMCWPVCALPALPQRKAHQVLRGNQPPEAGHCGGHCQEVRAQRLASHAPATHGHQHPKGPMRLRIHVLWSCPHETSKSAKIMGVWPPHGVLLCMHCAAHKAKFASHTATHFTRTCAK